MKVLCKYNPEKLFESICMVTALLNTEVIIADSKISVIYILFVGRVISTPYWLGR
jgi:hypothetical protein